MKKTLKVLALALVVVMVLGVGTTAFAADVPTSGGDIVSPNELQQITDNGGSITRTIPGNDPDTTVVVTITPKSGPIMQPLINWGQVQYGNWYNIGCNIVRSGQTIGTVGQDVYIGYTTRYYFGEMGTLYGSASAGWHNESIYTYPTDGVKYSFTIHAYFQNNSSGEMAGADVLFSISASGYVTYN